MILQLLLMFAASLLGTFGFGLLAHVPKRSWIPASVLGGLTFALYWGLTRFGVSDPAAVFLASAAGSFSGLFCARRMKMIGTVFLMMSIIAFVPGLGLYRTMQSLGAGQSAQGVGFLVQAMITIAMIVIGQGTGSFLFRAVHHR